MTNKIEITVHPEGAALYFAWEAGQNTDLQEHGAEQLAALPRTGRGNFPLVDLAPMTFHRAKDHRMSAAKAFADRVNLAIAFELGKRGMSDGLGADKFTARVNWKD